MGNSFGNVLASETTPEKLFDRRWAMTLFDQAMTRLREESARAGKDREFELLKEFLSSPSDDGAYANPASQLGVSEGAVTVQVHRLRKRYGQLVREEVAPSVTSTHEVDAELRHLLEVLSS